MDPKIPQELVYSPPDKYANVVLARNEVSMLAPTPSFTYNGANRIEFRISSSNFIDLASIEVYATITTVLTGAGTTHTVADATKYLPLHTMSMFSDLSIAAGNGTVIESVSNAQVLGQMVRILSTSEQYLNSVGSFANYQNQPFDRQSSATGVRVKISAHKLLGFLSCGKYVKPSTFGGLVLTLQLAPDASLGVVRAAGDSATTSLSVVCLAYDDLMVSPSYQDLYREEYESQSFRIGFSSWGTQAVNVASGASRTVPFAANSRRCRALCAASRVKSNVLNKEYAADAFLSSGYTSHHFEISGIRYPQNSCQGAAAAAEQIIAFNRSKMDCQSGQIFDMTSFTTDWARTNNANRASQLNGRLLLAYDAEKVGSHDQSGLRLDPGSCALNLVQTFAAETEVTIAWLYDRYITVSAGQIIVDY
jgi:hypothetical protein